MSKLERFWETVERDAADGDAAAQIVKAVLYVALFATAVLAVCLVGWGVDAALAPAFGYGWDGHEWLVWARRLVLGVFVIWACRVVWYVSRAWKRAGIEQASAAKYVPTTDERHVQRVGEAKRGFGIKE